MQCLLIPSPGLETSDTMGHHEELLQPCSPSGYMYWVSENSENSWDHLPLGLLGHFSACLKSQEEWGPDESHPASTVQAGEICNFNKDLSTSEHTTFHLRGLIHNVHFIHLYTVMLPFLDPYFLTVGGWSDTDEWIHSGEELALTRISLAEAILSAHMSVCPCDASFWKATITTASLSNREANVSAGLIEKTSKRCLVRS